MVAVAAVVLLATLVMEDAQNDNVTVARKRVLMFVLFLFVHRSF